MANEKNLVAQNKRTKSEQRRIASKGGKASGEARRKKKQFKDCMIQLLDMDVSDMRKYNKLARMGYGVEDINNKQLLTVALFAEAAKGNVAAFKEVKGLIGEDNATGDSGNLEKLIGGLKDE